MIVLFRGISKTYQAPTFCCLKASTVREKCFNQILYHNLAQFSMRQDQKFGGRTPKSTYLGAFYRVCLCYADTRLKNHTQSVLSMNLNEVQGTEHQSVVKVIQSADLGQQFNHFSGSQPCKRIVRGIGCSLQNWLIPGFLADYLVPCPDEGLLRISYRDLDIGAKHLTSGCRVVVLFSIGNHRRRGVLHS